VSRIKNKKIIAPPTSHGEFPFELSINELIKTPSGNNTASKEKSMRQPQLVAFFG